MVEDFDMITDFMDDDEDQPINMDKQFRIILFEPLSQLDKAALRKLTDYLKLMSEFLGRPHILKPYS